MQVRLHDSLQDSLIAREAAGALEACVHCGFCLATCPTYLDSRDERDSPRGRLYLLQELLEDGRGSAVAQRHLDRCLTCRACETTCPSGVAYGHIADAGRDLLEQRHRRPARERMLRSLLRAVIPRPRLFGALLTTGRLVRPLLPPRLKRAVPPRQRPLEPIAPDRRATGPARKRVILLEGCVQAAATPNTNLALRRILARLGIEVVETPAQGCCGALNTHLAAREPGRADMRRNIDAWTPALEAGVDAILVSASGCAAQVHDYAHALHDDDTYRERAARISGLLQDPAVFLAAQELPQRSPERGTPPRIAVHVPCTQQHALPHGDAVRRLLTALDFPLCETRDDHLCCGSAGTYSILQPAMSGRLRERKVAALTVEAPDLIVTANVGCQLHLADATREVRHWLEVVDEHLA